MNLVPVLNAAIDAVGGDSTSELYDIETLEKAQKVLSAVHKHIGTIIGDVEIASISVTAQPTHQQ